MLCVLFDETDMDILIQDGTFFTDLKCVEFK